MSRTTFRKPELINNPASFRVELFPDNVRIIKNVQLAISSRVSSTCSKLVLRRFRDRLEEVTISHISCHHTNRGTTVMKMIRQISMTGNRSAFVDSRVSLVVVNVACDYGINFVFEEEILVCSSGYESLFVAVVVV